MAGKKETRPKDERIKELTDKIKRHKEQIKTLEDKIESINNPKPRKKKPSINSVITVAKDSGMTAAEIAKKLGITIE